MRQLIFVNAMLLTLSTATFAQSADHPVAEGILPPPTQMALPAPTPVATAVPVVPALASPTPPVTAAPVVVATPTVIAQVAATTPYPIVAAPASTPYTYNNAPPVDAFTPPSAESPQVLRDTPWCDSPYRNSAWRIEFSLIPTSSDVSDFAFGDWKDNSSIALRLGLGYEGADGVGMRLLFWGIDQEAKTPVDDVDLDASTFYWDFYKRFFIDNAELTFGGGVAGSDLKYKLDHFSNKAEYSGGGISVFGEAFYPLWRFKSTDLGSVARGRIALMSGRWRDDGMPFINDTDHDVMSIFELGWGMELRHRFGPNEDKYWYIDLVPEFQRWDSASLPDSVAPGFEGTNISFGLAW